MKINFFLLSNMFIMTFMYGITPQEIDTIEQQKAKERSKAISDNQPILRNINLLENNATQKIRSHLIFNEKPCFYIKNIHLVGDKAFKFQSSLDKVLKDVNFTSKGECVGVNGIKELVTSTQNEIIKRGFVTSKVIINEQDLKSGQLEFLILSGKVDNIYFDLNEENLTFVKRAKKINAIPIKKGSILNIRDIEQGLENFKRLPTVEADIQIVPSTKEDFSDLNIKWSQKESPFRFSLSFDDAGSLGTGKYQTNLTTAIDNLLTINDIFYVSWGGDIGGYDKAEIINLDGTTNKEKGASYNRGLHYSIPLGYWLVSFNENRYNYHQMVAGANQIYDYSGQSKTSDIGLSYLFQRNSTGKSIISWKGWEKDTKSFIDDAEIIVQRRKIAGYEVGLSHEEKLGNHFLNFKTSYKQGTGARNATKAPEEAFEEGTHRMKIFTTDILFVGNISPKFKYEGTLHSQWNKTPLIAQDKLSIGGRYSIRGFDGNLVLSAERGWINRNTFTTPLNQYHQLYSAIDIGHVSGKSSQYLLGQTLIGSGFGVKGIFEMNGKLSYDIFSGFSLRKPQNFKTEEPVVAFSINYAF